MRIAFYLKSTAVTCRYGPYFLGSQVSMRAALPQIRSRQDRIALDLRVANSRRWSGRRRDGGDA